MGTKSCTCDICVLGCKQNPGWFAPGEAEKAAKLLGIGFEAFKKKFLIREYWVGGASVYAPRRTCQPKGFVTAQWSDNYLDAPCVFLTKDDRCKIHKAKPLECRETMCCKKNSGGSKMRDRIQRMWVKAGDPLGEDVS